MEMREGILHIRDVEGPKKTGRVVTRLEAMEQQVIKCQGMVERGLNANHMMITEFTVKHKIDANDIGKHLSRLYDRIDQLQARIYDLQNQNSILFLLLPLPRPGGRRPFFWTGPDNRTAKNPGELRSRWRLSASRFPAMGARAPNPKGDGMLLYPASDVRHFRNGGFADEAFLFPDGEL
ncbi:40S ribosomal protein S5-1 [Hordeum vulgare]|nr:40S ribosomal protein S5-1 [Hordeum vulgare]